MKPGFRVTVVFAVVFCLPSGAHVGSPDVFFDGPVGPYAARITIRMPAVVPGRAEIAVRVPGGNAADVSFRPLYSSTATTNAPPADLGKLIPGETNLYGGELWLMSFGAYSIEVKIRGNAGEGSVEIPVNSVAIRQLPLPPYLGAILLVLGAILIFGGLGIVVAAARESLLLPGLVPGRAERRKAWRTGVIAAIIIVLLLAGGKKWWSIDEKAFREGLRAGAWPDLLADVRIEGSRRILRLTLGKKEFGPDQSIALVPDHGKLLHLFVIRQPDHDAFGHLHPVRTGNQVFEVGLPPLPEGEYAVFCDLTFENSGFSSTATNSVHIPALLKATADQVSPAPDADDSWASSEVEAVRAGTNHTVCRLASGQQVVWKAHPPLRARQDAWLRFEVRDAAGKSIELEPYMGMMSHAAVLRSDGGVFAHLHPSGNYSMAAQSFFDAKMERETGKVSDAGMPAAMDHSRMRHQPANGAAPVISLPYEFPTVGNYRIWVQFKANGQVLTGFFDATVAGE